jgi:hypothetical protein
MAIITRFFPITKERWGRATTVECGFANVEIDGTAYLVLETYGSSHRANPGKQSQSIHLDRKRSAELKTLLEQRFPGI